MGFVKSRALCARQAGGSGGHGQVKAGQGRAMAGQGRAGHSNARQRRAPPRRASAARWCCRRSAARGRRRSRSRRGSGGTTRGRRAGLCVMVVIVIVVLRMGFVLGVGSCCFGRVVGTPAYPCKSSTHRVQGSSGGHGQRPPLGMRYAVRSERAAPAAGASAASAACDAACSALPAMNTTAPFCCVCREGAVGGVEGALERSVRLCQPCLHCSPQSLAALSPMDAASRSAEKTVSHRDRERGDPGAALLQQRQHRRARPRRARSQAARRQRRCRRFGRREQRRRQRREAAGRQQRQRHGDVVAAM